MLAKKEELQKMDVYVGIDPGISGAIAVINAHNEVCKVYDLPLEQIGKKRRIDALQLADILKSILSHYNVIACALERVSSSPQQGVGSAFTFGDTSGVIRGAISTLGLRLFFITPQKWKSNFHLVGKEKDESRRTALQYFPDAVEMLKRKKDVDRAEALLLALSACMQWKRVSGHSSPSRKSDLASLE